MTRLNRSTFLALGAAAPAFGVPAAAFAQTSRSAPSPGLLERALVLSGGGALGAYEAGAVTALAAQAGVSDGQPLAPYGLVCGTSIGALNAYLIATAQYTKLRNIWGTIAAENAVRLKPQFAKIKAPSSGVLTRIGQAMSLALGMNGDVMGVLDGEHLRRWLLSYFDFSKPIVTPFIWAVTNMTDAQPEYFYLPAANATGENRALALTAMQLAVGSGVPLRMATPDLLVDQLRASAATPLAFDPVMLAGPDGKPAAYSDGGITANTPIAVARALAKRVDTIMLNPVFESATYKNGIDVAEGSFNTMQRRLMEDSLRSVYFQAFIMRALKSLPPDFSADAAKSGGITLDQLAAVVAASTPVDLYLMRPKTTLPIKMMAFDDQAAIAETYAIGVAAGNAGFSRFQFVF